MPPTRSTRLHAHSSLPAIGAKTSVKEEALPVVPPFEEFTERLKWAYKLRSVDGSDFMSAISTKASSSSKRGTRWRCELCKESVEGDQKTLDRHVKTNKHVFHLADRLRVDLDSLRSGPMHCKHCDRGIAGGRKDSLKRHEANCKRNPERISCTPDPEVDVKKRLRRAISLTDVDRSGQKRVRTVRPLGRATSTTYALASRASSSKPRATTTHGTAGSSSSPTTQPPPPPPPPPAAPVHTNISTYFDPSSNSIGGQSNVTQLYYGMPASRVGTSQASANADAFFSALRQPVVAVRHSTEYGLWPPPFFVSDPLFCLGPAAMGFDTNDSLSGAPLEWDWLVQPDLFI